MKTIEEAQQQLTNGCLDETLIQLCVKAESLSGYRARILKMLPTFTEKFGKEREIAIFSAPGRTEIGGNHTDHQRGCVLAGSINLDIIAVVAKRTDRKIYVQSEGYPLGVCDLDDLEPLSLEKEPHAIEVIRGIAARFQQMGVDLPYGFDAYTTSKVAKGSGISSSAAFEILFGNVFNAFYADNRFDAVTLAKIGQYAENVYYRKPCGLMDQMASSVGGACAIDFFDPNAPVIRPVSFDFSKTGYALCIVNTGGSHSDLTDEYAAIPAEMHAVASQFGKDALVDVPEEDFMAELPHLRKTCGDRAVLRAMHFFQENVRAKEETAALESGDFDRFLQLVRESGKSSYCLLQNVFPSSNPKNQPASIVLALGERVLNGRGAIRIHGGGFGGTVQAFVPEDLLPAFTSQMEKVLGKGCVHALQIRPVGGTTILI